MAAGEHADVRALEALDAVDDDARKLIDGLTAEQGIWRPAPADAATEFFSSQEQARAFLRKYAEIDLAGVRFPNPFIPGVRFSLATGLHVIAAHNRRHAWQAWNVRRALLET